MVEEVFGAADDDAGEVNDGSDDDTTSDKTVSETVEPVDVDGGFFMGLTIPIMSSSTNSLVETTKDTTSVDNLDKDDDNVDSAAVVSAENFLRERTFMREMAQTAYGECREGVAKELILLDDYANTRLGTSLNTHAHGAVKDDTEQVIEDKKSMRSSIDEETDELDEANAHGEGGNLLDRLIQQSRERVQLLKAMGKR